jgi:hypothetical protein
MDPMFKVMTGKLALNHLIKRLVNPSNSVSADFCCAVGDCDCDGLGIALFVGSLGTTSKGLTFGGILSRK